MVDMAILPMSPRTSWMPAGYISACIVWQTALKLYLLFGGPDEVFVFPYGADVEENNWDLGHAG